MQIFNSLSSINKNESFYVALGNFDGLHKGHKYIIKKCIYLAQDFNSKSCVLTFNPHPQLVLDKSKIEGVITSKSVKEKLLAKTGLDFAIFLPFDKELANLSPESFVKDILIKYLNIKGVVVGFNFTFGKKGIGEQNVLKELGEKYGFNVTVIPPFYESGKIVSSSLIRYFFHQGDVKLACKFLGYSPIIQGCVKKGEKIGRTLGFPTANVIPEENSLIPKMGVYATKIFISGKKYYSVTNVGIKPTFGSHETSIETYILNYSGCLYNKEVTLSFLERIRDEKKFQAKEDLILQIKDDEKIAKEIFKSDSYKKCKTIDI